MKGLDYSLFKGYNKIELYIIDRSQVDKVIKCQDLILVAVHCLDWYAWYVEWSWINLIYWQHWTHSTKSNTNLPTKEAATANFINSKIRNVSCHCTKQRRKARLSLHCKNVSKSGIIHDFPSFDSDSQIENFL